eukprot:SAG31_NODE_4485_length_3196_cov_1.445270_1_plen_41_part_10
MSTELYRCVDLPKTVARVVEVKVKGKFRSMYLPTRTGTVGV